MVRKLLPDADIIEVALFFRVKEPEAYKSLVVALNAHADRAMRACIGSVPAMLSTLQGRAQEALDLADLFENIAEYERELRNIRNQNNAKSTPTRGPVR